MAKDKGLTPEQQEINEINEKEYLAKIKEKSKKNLIKLDYLERERIAKHIKDLYNDAIGEHNKLCDKIDEYDQVYRMERVEQSGSDGDLPNYRTSLSTVTLEVVHANIMNVFFSPKDIMRAIPTEQGDIPKIKKLDIFGNWSMENEINIFDNADRLFHSSGKNGECPYIMYWTKEYGTEIVIEPVMNPADPTQPLIDEDTKEPITQEREVTKKLYDGPKLEVFSRKDYILPRNATADKLPDWEMRRVRFTADKVKRYELEGKFYNGVFTDIEGWGISTPSTEDDKIDTEGQSVPLGTGEKVFVEFYGRLRVNAVKKGEESEEQYEELEDEFITIMELKSETLCALRKNKFPLKMRPTDLDLFIPDDEGRRKGIGVIEFMDSIQRRYDALTNQYLFGTMQSNSPFGFFAPTANQRDEPIKARTGYLYPTADPGAINIVKIPPPDASLLKMMEETRNQAQLLFGISDYSAGIESQIDPTAPAKKAEVVLAQGNVRLNLIIKRRNKTLKNIFKRWFLLYQANMPPNKFMRIAGTDKDSPWQFDKMNITDFALKAIPDFELTGNILNANKALEANKKLAIYQIAVQNPFFNPQTTQGMQALHAVTKWLLDGLDETGISNFLPPVPGDEVQTPEEENARFMQGDEGEPSEGEDHVNHIRVHSQLILDPTVPDDVKKMAVQHNAKHTDMLKKQITQQTVLARAGQMQPQTGGTYGQGQGGPTPQAFGNVFPVAGMGRPAGVGGTGIQ